MGYIITAFLVAGFIIQNTVMKRADKLYNKFEKTGITMKLELSMYAYIAFVVLCIILTVEVLPHR